MGKIKNLMIETDEEREVFERLQRDNALQALHDENERLGLYKDVYGEKSVAMPDYLHLMDELAIARMLIRELGDRLSKLEKPWVDLTKEECFELCVKHKDNSFSLLVAVQEKLKEKNNG